MHFPRPSVDDRHRCGYPSRRRFDEDPHPYRPRSGRRRSQASQHLQRGDTVDSCEFAGTVIGDVLLALRSAEHQTLEIGYVFHPDYGGQGFATETVRALVDLAFGIIGARRIIARVDTRNRRSCTLLKRSVSDWRHIWSRTNGSKES